MKRKSSEPIMDRELGDKFPILSVYSDGNGIKFDGSPVSIFEKGFRCYKFSTHDASATEMDAFIHAIIHGWSTDAYLELKEDYGWTDEEIQGMKELQEKYMEIQHKTWR